MFKCVGVCAQKCTHICKHMMCVFAHMCHRRPRDNCVELVLCFPLSVGSYDLSQRYLGFFRKHLYPLKCLLRPLLFSLAYKGMGAIVSTFVLLFCSLWIFSAFPTHPAGLRPEPRRKNLSCVSRAANFAFEVYIWMEKKSLKDES